MKAIVTSALGAAAILVAVGGAARAADLPMAEPVSYVKVCDAYGKGYFYIPGTQTCLQISGLARLQVEYTEPFTRGADSPDFRTRMRIQFDARTQTEWGTLRAYLRLQSDFSENDKGHSDPGGPFGAPTPANTVYPEKAYVQFAGITAGLSQSFYDFIPSEFFVTNLVSDQTALLAAYSAQLGPVVATLSAEDRSYREESNGAIGPLPLTGPLAYAGTRMPDLVASLSVKQGWGSAQLSGVVRQLRATVPATTDYGFAVQGGVKLFMPVLAKNDYVWLVGSYADGALAYLGGTTGVEGTAGPWVGTGLIAFSDAYVTPTAIERAHGFQITGGFTHFWRPDLRSNLGAVYLDVDAPGRVDDFSELTLVGNIIWSPVPDLDLGLELINERMLSDNVPGGIRAFSGGGAAGDRWSGIARIERRF